eukprot:c42044_g1_i1 orf=58-237(+)
MELIYDFRLPLIHEGEVSTVWGIKAANHWKSSDKTIPEHHDKVLKKEKKRNVWSLSLQG